MIILLLSVFFGQWCSLGYAIAIGWQKLQIMKIGIQNWCSRVWKRSTWLALWLLSKHFNFLFLFIFIYFLLFCVFFNQLQSWHMSLVWHVRRIWPPLLHINHNAVGKNLPYIFNKIPSSCLRSRYREFFSVKLFVILVPFHNILGTRSTMSGKKTSLPFTFRYTGQLKTVFTGDSCFS